MAEPASLFFGAFLAAFAKVAVEHLMKKLYREAILPIFASLVFLVLAAWWSQIRGIIGPTLASSVDTYAADFRVWLGLIAIVLVYSMATSIVYTIKTNNVERYIKEDIPALNAAMRAYVLPRNLTPRQKSQVGEFLKRFPTREITMKVIKNDNEASNFMADLQNAIEQGGWTTKTIEYVSEAQEGLIIHFDQTQSSAQTASGPRNPKDDTILQQALALGGVQVDSSSGGSSTSITSNSLFLIIGHRRREVRVYTDV